MRFSELKKFISEQMRMSHIYQPVMLMALLENEGKCDEKEIAKILLSYDKSQIDYYSAITRNMPGKVLKNHGVITRDKVKKEYSLVGSDELTDIERLELINLCKSKLQKFMEIRGSAIYEHRTKSSGYISGTIRYEVLKRAKFRCELCGISADKKALEVDHITPRNKGGKDELINYQALCYSCNSMKSDRDNTDFRDISDLYENRDCQCIFCNIPKERVIQENYLAYAIRDGYPVTENHTLIIPKRHVETYFQLGQAEINAVNQIMQHQKNEIESNDALVTGFNIGINSGESAGQTIFHCHVHLIPRRIGDVEKPKGGVRHLIPGKGYY